MRGGLWLTAQTKTSTRFLSVCNKALITTGRTAINTQLLTNPRSPNRKIRPMANALIKSHFAIHKTRTPQLLPASSSEEEEEEEGGLYTDHSPS